MPEGNTAIDLEEKQSAATEQYRKYKSKIITIPNVLSLFRLLLIPAFMYFYLKESHYGKTAAVLLLSGVTDIMDGFIARKFQMTSDLGKVLDPIADKLTQVAMLWCLLTRFPRMIIPLIVLIIKETFTGICSLVAIKRSKEVHGAKRHGKVATALLYGMMITHVIWYNIPDVWSDIFITVCLFFILLSLILYAKRNWCLIYAE